MGKKLKVVVVDDDVDLSEIIQMVLHKVDKDWEVEVFNDPLLALQSIEYADAVISDFQMPGMNGVDFLVRLAEKLPSPGIPFLALYSAYKTELMPFLAKTNLEIKMFTKPESVNNIGIAILEKFGNPSNVRSG